MALGFPTRQLAGWKPFAIAKDDCGEKEKNILIINN
jgi:hypothetical protein